MSDNALDKIAWRILEREKERLERKVYLLDRAQLAHNVFVVVYSPEATEHGDRMIVQTRVVVVANDEIVWHGVVDTTSRSISELMETIERVEARQDA